MRVIDSAVNSLPVNIAAVETLKLVNHVAVILRILRIATIAMKNLVLNHTIKKCRL